MNVCETEKHIIKKENSGFQFEEYRNFVLNSTPGGYLNILLHGVMILHHSTFPDNNNG